MPGQGKIAVCGTLAELLTIVVAIMLVWTISKVTWFSIMFNSWIECCQVPREAQNVTIGSCFAFPCPVLYYPRLQNQCCTSSHFLLLHDNCHSKNTNKDTSFSFAELVRCIVTVMTPLAAPVSSGWTKHQVWAGQEVPGVRENWVTAETPIRIARKQPSPSSSCKWERAVLEWRKE